LEDLEYRLSLKFSSVPYGGRRVKADELAHFSRFLNVEIWEQRRI